ncbi:MAG: glutamine--fructose-6-phosphate transaminase (isomerizing) [Syntrophomonadaceae bacterium]|nr:glutamine--fructose-6-phosphate transaminase (isomerizing) [Syntrophomonadaceae bacterium]
MCGIMGYIGSGNAVPLILDGLARLEYRGYDSAGIAILQGNEIQVRKKEGRLSGLIEAIGQPPAADLGIGHTRWATHGIPSDRNAHPHQSCDERIALVHNGILENYMALKKELCEEGHRFKSETDTEVIVHLIEKYYQDDLEAAVREALTHMQGSYAIAVISRDEPQKLIAAKKDSPLIIGLGEGENYVASDIPAILHKTDQVYILQDEELAVLTADRVAITDFSSAPVEREIFKVTWDPVSAEKGGYEHFMLKEIHEQPRVLTETLRGMIGEDGSVDMSGSGAEHLLREVKKIYIVACGTAYHAGLIGRYAIEKLARIPVEADIASEFRYRDVLWQPQTLMIVISQSGETADTLAALREAHRHGVPVLAVTNVVGSSVAREADAVIYTHAGPEIAVASTKAYISQILVMYLLALQLARPRPEAGDGIRRLSAELLKLPAQVEAVLKQEAQVKALAQKYQDVQSTFFLGRGLDFAVAMEGALKLKEISYVHAEAYAAGELKHGPLALIDHGVPVLALITQSHLVDKSISNIKEVKARGAVVIAICPGNLAGACAECDEQILLPDIDDFLSPLAAVVPLQLFAYYMAVFRQADVDKPKNLAKSVTVE